MPSSHADHPTVPLTASEAQPLTTPARSPRLTRRAAFALAGGTVGVLGIGWLADLLAIAPLTAAPSGPRTRQVGLYHVALDLRPTPPRAGSPAQAVLAVNDAAGAALPGLVVEVAATMVEMDMLLPSQRAAEIASQARYVCALTFLMAGTWRMDVRFGMPGTAPLTASFDVTAR